MYVSQGDILTFDNGMVGTVTGKGRVALVSPQGWATPAAHMPLLTDYNAKYRIVRVEERPSQDAPLDLVWEDETYYFRFKKYHKDLSDAELKVLDEELSAIIDAHPQYWDEGIAA